MADNIVSTNFWLTTIFFKTKLNCKHIVTIISTVAAWSTVQIECSLRPLVIGNAEFRMKASFSETNFAENCN